MAAGEKFSSTRRRPSVPVIILIVLLHVLAFYGLMKALAPDFTGQVEDTVLSAVTVTVTTPPPPPEPDQEDEGAQGDPGAKATPKPTTAPSPKIAVRKDQPQPKATSTGNENRSGANDSGDGTGARGSGDGTGGGRGGDGRGSGVAVTKPVHISGGIDNARDYPTPPGGRNARRGTEVIVKVTVGVNGRASNCSIYRASPDPEADRITCQLVVQRLGFRPATNAAGEPVPAPFYWRQQWF